MTDPHRIDSLPALLSLFGEPAEAARIKETPTLHPLYREMIAASPFVAMATVGPNGLDVSPRGDPAGFVQAENDTTLLLPERRGNNRIDSLRNLVADPRIALLFLIPGIGETLRVNGTATIHVAPDLLARFAMDGKLPKCVLVVKVETVYFQCARAIQRSGLWQSRPPDEARRVPTAGAILAAVSAGGFDGESYDRELPARQKSTLY